MRRSTKGRTKVTHGMSYSPTYIIWRSMKQRCQWPKHVGYKNYGGRGITVCERWQFFEHFYADMGPRPSPEHSLDRINSDGNYEPSNCRWVLFKYQQRNTRRSVLTAESVAKARELRASGMTYKQIAQTVQATASAVKIACQNRTWK